MEMMGACIFCGQMYIIEGEFDNEDEKELNRKASEMCGCIGSQYLKKANFVAAEVRELAETKEELDILNDASDFVMSGPIKAVSMAFEDGKVIKIKKSKGEITISKERKEKREKKL